EKTRVGQSLDPLGPATRAYRLFYVAAPNRVRYGQVSQRLRERSGGAERLTGQPRAQPACRALSCVCRCVIERVGAHRPLCPDPLAFDWTSAPAPVYER